MNAYGIITKAQETDVYPFAQIQFKIAVQRPMKTMWTIIVNNGFLELA
jgi:hypothetical protein